MSHGASTLTLALSWSVSPQTLHWPANISSFAVRFTHIALHHEFTIALHGRRSHQHPPAFSGFPPPSRTAAYSRLTTPPQHFFASHIGSTTWWIGTGCTQAAGLLGLDHGGGRQKECGTHSVGAGLAHGASQLCVANHVVTAYGAGGQSVFVRGLPYACLEHFAAWLGAPLIIRLPCTP